MRQGGAARPHRPVGATGRRRVRVPRAGPRRRRAVGGHRLNVASVAGAFPSGLGPLAARLEEIRWVVANGADEVDIVLNRSAFLGGQYGRAFDDIAASKEACGPAHLKVILETGELGPYDQVRKASALAMAAGADFIKTSTGKIGTSATLPVALCMAEAIRDFAEQTGRPVGLKVAGGIRTAKQAWQYLVVVFETLGSAWLTPDRFRLGASSLLNDLLMQLARSAPAATSRPTSSPTEMDDRASRLRHVARVDRHRPAP